MDVDVLSPVLRDVLEDARAVDDKLERLVDGVQGRLASSSLATLKAGGKRLRPVLLLLAGMVGEYRKEALLRAAVAVELIHMASLVHDDVLDGSSLRRGKPTVFSIWGSKMAIATGDFLFAEAFKLLSEFDDRRVMELAAQASLALSVGELQEQKTLGRINLSVREYIEMVSNKTARLFATSCELGAVIGGANDDEHTGLASYGQCLGVAFQIYDDLLDFSSTAKVLGKPVGSDLRQGNLTLPVIYAMEESPRSARLAEIVQNERAEDADIEEGLTIIRQTAAIERGRQEAGRYVERAIAGAEVVGHESVRHGLLEIGNFVISRYH